MKILSKVEEKKLKVEGSKCKKQNAKKDKAKLRKKFLKVLKSNDIYSSAGDSEEDNTFIENLDKYVETNGNNVLDKKRVAQNSKNTKAFRDHDKIKVKNEKKLIKNKETLQEENDMVNVISNIITSKSKIPSNKKMFDLVLSDTDKCKYTEFNTIDSPAVFDPNRSLAKKIKMKLGKKKAENKPKQPIKSCSTLKLLENCNSIKTKKLFSQNVNYKHSVMEIFGCGKLKGAVVKTPDFNLNLNKNVSDNTIIDEGNTSTEYSQNEDMIDAVNQDVLNNSQCIDTPQQDVEKLYNIKSSLDLLTCKSTKFKIFTFSKCCVLIMKQNTILYFSGMLEATLLRGNVEILGHSMDSTAQQIYSPPISSLLYFQSHEHTDKPLDVTKLLKYEVSENDSEIISKNTGSSDSLLILQPHSNVMTDFITKHFSYFNVFFKEKLDDMEFAQAFKLLQCQFFTDARKGLLKLNLMSAPIAQKIVRRIKTETKNVTMICGGKNAGKSTFLRYLINRCIPFGPVLVLDLDPGQPEFTVCGLLSATVVCQPVLGPNFSHLKNPDRSLALGFISISENIDRYMACVQDLYKYCSAYGKYSDMPWIINTSGFTGPIGLKLASFIINLIGPSLVIEVSNSVKRLNFDIRLEPENINEYQKTIEFIVDDNVIQKDTHCYDYYNLEPFHYMWTSSKPSLCRNVEPKDERLLSLIAYFSQISNSNLSILEEPPYMISMDDVTLAFNNVCVDEQYLYSVINAKLVALCHDDDVNDREKHLVNINLFSCYGYGIIRGVDHRQQKIYITTPVKPELISFVNTIVYGEALPDCGSMAIQSLAQGTFVPYTIPFVNSDFNKQLMKTPKRKFNPFRLLEIRSKS